MKKNLFGVSMITLTSLYFLLTAIIFLICIITGENLLLSIIVSMIVLLVQFLISPFITDFTVKVFYKANFNAALPDYLTNFINSVCTNESMKFPRVAVIDDGSPNAFTYGHTKNDARIVITRGLYELLTPEEVMAVVGHELGHATHYDMLFMTVAQMFPLIFYAIYEIFRSKDSDNNSGYTAIISIVAYILYIISRYVVLWLSRTREYYADYFSATATKNPNALASALVKIGFGLTINSDSKKISETEDENEKKNLLNKHKSQRPVEALGIMNASTSKSLIVCTNNNSNDTQAIKNAMKWDLWNPWAFIYELQSTHPLISKRLIALSKLSNEYGQSPFITFDLEKEESYVDDFLLEVLIKYIPSIFMFITCVVGIFAIILASESNNLGSILLSVTGILGLISTLLYIYRFKRSHKTNFQERKINSLLGEVKVSSVTCIPCTLNGKLIGRGDAGNMFNEDFYMQDDTGIMFLDYNQPIGLWNTLHGLFKSKSYIGKEVIVKGWYRRSPVPYVEMREYTIDGQTKKVHTYGFTMFIYGFLIVFNILLILTGLGI